MADGDVRTYYENGQWKSGVDGNSRASHVDGTKAEQSAETLEGLTLSGERRGAAASVSASRLVWHRAPDMLT